MVEIASLSVTELDVDNDVDYPLSGLRVICREGWPLPKSIYSVKSKTYGCSGILESFEDAVSWT